MRGVIYKYTSPSEKVYIGQTYNEKARKKRFRCLSASYGSAKIDNARRKYGAQNFEYEVLYTIETEDKSLLMKELNEKEAYFIEEFDSINSGYNILKGGTNAYQEHIITKEIRDKISKNNSKTIWQYTLEGEFIKSWTSTLEIENCLRIQHSLISKNCKRQTTHCRNFIFRYEGDIVLDSEKNPKLNNTKNMSIIQIKSGTIIGKWKSIASAAIDLKINRKNLSKMLKNGDINIGDTIVKLEE